MEMTERKKLILKAVINEYILTAEPVGSRTLSRRYDFGVSPATIRNEMADLEETDYLVQPHRSAGRIPTDKGYRFYVDSLMDEKKFSKKKREMINEKYILRENGIQELIQHTTKMLSDLTNYTSLVVTPQMEESFFQHVQLVPISSQRVLMVLVTDTGIIKNKIINLPQSIVREDLDIISRFLNERLFGLEISNIREETLLKLSQEVLDRISVSLNDLNFINQELYYKSTVRHGKVYLGGATHILEHPEFSDINKIKSVLNFLEQEQLLYDIMDNINQHTGVNVVIGAENYLEEIQDCSVVIANYHLNGRPVGKIGVIGPTRMEYSSVVSTVKYIANLLSEFLTNK